MGTKYSSQTISGYNTSPPSDDGSQTAANQVTWAKHKTKLGDPLKTLIEAVNSNLVTALDTSVRAISSNDTLTAADHWKTIQCTTNTAGITVSLGDAATMAAGYIVAVHNKASSSGSVTVNLATATNTLNTYTNGTHVIPAGATLEFIVASPATGYLTRGPFSGRLAIAAGGLTANRTITPPDADLTIPAVTAKGDIVAASASGVLARVPVSATNGDVLIADSSATAGVSYRTKITLGTEQATTSGTSIDFTSIPDWVKRITVMLVGVSTNGTSIPILQIGDSGGIENTGYNGTVANQAGTAANLSSGFAISPASVTAAAVFQGAFTLTLENASTNTWACTAFISRSDATNINMISGTKALSATLDRVRLTTAGGTDTFDAGAINIAYE